MSGDEGKEKIQTIEELLISQVFYSPLKILENLFKCTDSRGDSPVFNFDSSHLSCPLTAAY